MPSPHRLLLAIDDSEASRKATTYVADVVRGMTHFEIRLVHVLPHVPSGLLEHGGRSTDEAQEAVQQKLDEGTARWRARCERAAAALIDGARESLERAGVDPERIHVRFAAPLPEETIGHHLVTAAHETGARTIVVGRAPRSWLTGAFHRSPSSALFRKQARGMAVWIVT